MLAGESEAPSYERLPFIPIFSAKHLPFPLRFRDADRKPILWLNLNRHFTFAS